MKNNKEVCQECGRLLRTKNFRSNPILNKKICQRCDKKIGHNKYYQPEIKGVKKRKKPTNYAITDDEDRVLYRKKIRKGENAREGVKFVKHYINRFYQKKRYEERMKKIKDEDKQKKFIEGLK